MKHYHVLIGSNLSAYLPDHVEDFATKEKAQEFFENDLARAQEEDCFRSIQRVTDSFVTVFFEEGFTWDIEITECEDPACECSRPYYFGFEEEN